MLRTLSRIWILIGLTLIVAVLGASTVEAKGSKDQKNGEVPFVFSGIPHCIDFNSSSDCDPDDEDADGWTGEFEIRVGSDPQDSASTPENGLLDEQTGSSICRDGVDNDLDGRRDRRDSSCRVTCRDFAGRKACTDRDDDGWLRYVEIAYGSNPNDPLSTPETSSLPDTCFDGLDNDMDGATDDADASCVANGIGTCIDFTNNPDPACDPA